MDQRLNSCRRGQNQKFEKILAEVIAYEKDIPRIGQEIDAGELEREIHGQWHSLH